VVAMGPLLGGLPPSPLQWVEVVILGGGGGLDWLLEGDPPRHCLIWLAMGRASLALAVAPRWVRQIWKDLSTATSAASMAGDTTCGAGQV
jgi:hypothetical protein